MVEQEILSEKESIDALIQNIMPEIQTVHGKVKVKKSISKYKPEYENGPGGETIPYMFIRWEFFKKNFLPGSKKKVYVIIDYRHSKETEIKAQGPYLISETLEMFAAQPNEAVEKMFKEYCNNQHLHCNIRQLKTE